MIRTPFTFGPATQGGNKARLSPGVSTQGITDIQAALSALQFPHANSEHSAQNAKNRWMLPYADLMTLLLGLFLVMFASQMPSKTPESKYQSIDFTGLLSNFESIEQQQPRVETADLEFSLAAESADLKWALADQKLAANVSTRGQKTILSFDEELFFAPGDARLSPSAKLALHKLASILKTTQGHIRVEGHTDNTPIHTSTYPSNWELSTMRATVILRELISAHHFDPSQISAAGYGEFSPIADNKTEAGRRRNRRVDIVIEKTTTETTDSRSTALPKATLSPTLNSPVATGELTTTDMTPTGAHSNAQTN